MASDLASPVSLPPNALLIAGPTAVGKSEIAFQLARELNGEIISVDSMQVYRGMDIGTAKPSQEQRAQVRHHLIDVVEMHESFNAVLFVELATRAVTEINNRGAVPIFCGGTGLYFKALIEGLSGAPPGNKELRDQLERISDDELLRELAQTDPAMFQRIDQRNRRRIIRAVEVIRVTGKPYSMQRADWQHKTDKNSDGPRLIGLIRPSGELNRRIESRVESMFRSGLVEETQALVARGLLENPTAMQALGYRQVVESFKNKRSLPQTIELVKIRTRQFAKRQMTWFKRQAVVDWISLGPDMAANLANVRLHIQNSRKNHLSSK